MKLYYHKTDGGAEYLTDTFIPWEHDGKSGNEGTITLDTKIAVRIDGDITKDAEISIQDNAPELLEVCKLLAAWDQSNDDAELISRACSLAREAIRKAKGE